jgi:hypothetical protein
MQFTDYIKSVTQDKIVPKVVDTILGGNVIALKFLSNGKPWSGETLKFPVKYQKNSTSQGSYDGFDTFDTTKVNTRTMIGFNPTGFYQSIVLSDFEIDVNDASETQVLDLVKLEMESGMQDMLDSLGDIFYGAQSGKNFLGLQDLVDDGTTTATYGGLSRATYTSLKATKTAASGGLLSLSFLAGLVDAATLGAQKPDMGVTTEAIWTLYESLAQPANVINQQGYAQMTRSGVAASRAALNGELGFDTLFFRGIPLVKDEKCTSGRIYFLNSNTINWHGLRSKKYKNIDLSSSLIEGGQYEKDVPKSYGFIWKELMSPVNQAAEIGQIMLRGQLICNNPRLNSVGTTITGA